MNYYQAPRDLYHSHWNVIAELIHSYAIIDRQQIADLGFEYSVHSPMPAQHYTSLTLDDCINKRVQEIKDFHNDKPILLLWSGGIDSTMVFCALMQANIKFTVGYSIESEQEYPWLMARMQQGEFPGVTLKKLTDSRLFLLQKDYYVVNGINGDQIIGTNGFYDEKTTGIRPRLEDNYEDVIPPYLMQLLEPNIDAFPIKLLNYADWLWWFNFMFKYQAVSLGFIESHQFDTTATDTYCNFFDSLYFQQWAMSNRELNLEWLDKRVVTDYKKVYKQYIFKYLGDTTYYINKRKEPSRVDSLRIEHDVFIINDNNKMVPSGDCSWLK